MEGGVTVVQVREKTTDTGEVGQRQLPKTSHKFIWIRAQFLEIARATKRLCEQYKVPLIINDRIDIALAVAADGVHLGQTDMPIEIARKLLPEKAIVGISCNTREEVERAVSAGADYIGIGPVYATSTKQVTNPLLGPRNLGGILAALENTDVKSVAIGTLSQLVYGIQYRYAYRWDKVNERSPHAFRIHHDLWEVTRWSRCGQRHRRLSRASDSR